MARGKLTPYDEQTKKVISARITSLLDRSNTTQRELSKATKIPGSTLTGYVKGYTLPSAGNVQKIADYFNVLKSEIDPRFKPVNVHLPPTKTKKVPILGTIACGDPITADENIEGYRETIADLLPSGTVFYLKAKGQSMEPTIPNGSHVLIREQPTVEDGEIAAVLVDNDSEATLKRIKHQGDIVMLMPDNHEYDPIILSDDYTGRIIGKAIRFVADL